MLQFVFKIRNLPDVLMLCFVTALQAAMLWSLLREPAARRSQRLRTGLKAGFAVSIAVLLSWFASLFPEIAPHLPRWFILAERSVAVLWAFLSVLLSICYVLAKLIAAPHDGHSPARRQFLGAVRWALYGAPVAAVGYGTFVVRHQLVVREQDIRIPNLPQDLDGLKIAQVTDIHLSQFLSVKEVERAVAMANELRPNLTLVTGDLITGEGDPLDDCLRALKQLRADSGIYGCMGNHEIYANTADYTEQEGARIGITFLRRKTSMLRFGEANLNLVGVDYQRLGKHYLRGMEQYIAPDAFNVLLSHNPDVFPVAAAQGYPLTIAGHTHGGQVKVEILRADLNISRFYTPYVDGLYQKDGKAIFVSRGIGTIGLPTRLGATPEVAYLRLWRT